MVSVLMICICILMFRVVILVWLINGGMMIDGLISGKFYGMVVECIG